MRKTLLLLGVALCTPALATAATCTLSASSNWSAATWTGCPGGPTATDDVVVPSTATLTVDGDYTVNNLTLQGTSGTRLTINAGNILTLTNTLNGSSTSPPVNIISGAGMLRFTGGTRTLIGTNWSANPIIPNLTVELNVGTIGSITTAVKVTTLRVISGTLSAPNEIRIDSGSGSNGGGSTVIEAGATIATAGFGQRTSTSGTFGGPVNVDGTLTVTGGWLRGSAVTIGATGRLRLTSNTALSTTGNSGFVYDAGATLEYGNTGNKTAGIEWPAASGPSNVRMTGANGVVTLSGSRSLDGELRLSNGKLSLATYDLTLGAGASVSGGGATSYVITGGTGVLTRQSVGATAALFPIGTATVYNPVTLSNTGTTDDFSARITTTPTQPSPNPDQALNVEWILSEATPGGTDAALTFQWQASQQGPSFDPSGTVALGHYNAITSSFEEYSGTVSGSDPYVLSTSGVTSFSPFTIGMSGSLPVELVNFAATASGNAARLSWTTASETNNVGFVVERQNGQTWTDASPLIAGAGTTTERHAYAFDVTGLAAGTHAFRLRQIDTDGTVNYSAVVSVEVALDGAFAVSVLGERAVRVAVQQPQAVSVRVFDVLGRAVATLRTGELSGSEDVALPGGLASGAYLVRVEGEHFVHTARLVVR